jgi:hypothetical protein
LNIDLGCCWSRFAAWLGTRPAPGRSPPPRLEERSGAPSATAPSSRTRSPSSSSRYPQTWPRRSRSRSVRSRAPSRPTTPRQPRGTARRLLGAESVASSRIEGLVLSERRLARAEAEEPDARGETARSVLGCHLCSQSYGLRVTPRSNQPGHRAQPPAGGQYGDPTDERGPCRGLVREGSTPSPGAG